MIEIKPIYDSVNFNYRIAIFKNGEKVTSFPEELMNDLTFRSPKRALFKGPELTKDEMMVELMTAMKNDCPELDDTSVQDLVGAFKPILEIFKIKVWNGQTMPFSTDT